MSEQINHKLFDEIEQKLNKDGYGLGSCHPVWVLFNYKDEIVKSILIKEKVEKYDKLFPENELLQELLS